MPATASPPRADARAGTRSGTLVVACALPAEARALAGLARPGVVVARTGVGPRMAAAAAARLLDPPPAGLVAAGFCGAAGPDLRPGEVVVAREVVDGASGERFAADPGLLGAVAGRRGTLVSRPALARTPAERAAGGGDAVDMESAALARACRDAGVPFLAVRAVSDPAHRPLPDLLALVDPAGRPRAGRIARHLARRPGQVLVLARLGRDAGRAGAALAAALAPLAGARG
ncbi:MAG: hypothetical protein MUE51_06675 [Thermoleophilia bacterium]|jgi:hypothetical protein|nr:hypothetical protein [Thermoleophilia bacterium]